MTLCQSLLTQVQQLPPPAILGCFSRGVGPAQLFYDGTRRPCGIIHVRAHVLLRSYEAMLLIDCYLGGDEVRGYLSRVEDTLGWGVFIWLCVLSRNLAKLQRPEGWLNSSQQAAAFTMAAIHLDQPT